MDSESECISKFFRIILQDNITQGRLEIPSGFVTKHGNSLRNPITLELPNGEKWKVKISKIGEDQIWLAQGWLQFANHHSIKFGHVLVFEYLGNSHFIVHIYDMSATEIEYTESQPEMNQSDEEITDLISDLHIQKDFTGNVGSSSKVNKSETKINFTSSKPWFQIVVKSIPQLHIPQNFVKKHMDYCKSKTVILKVGDKSWDVKFKVYPNKRQASMYAGMTCFLRDNSLKEGDVCVFELISTNSFNVTIFRI